MIFVYHLKALMSQSVPWLLGALVRPAHLTAVAPTQSRSEHRRQAASDSSIASSIGVALLDQARCALARYSDGSLP